MAENTLLELVALYDGEHAWLRQFVIPEEDRWRHTTAKWSGEYRWFRSPNVVCIEKARLVRSARLTPPKVGASRP